jgi:hypothetical protein
MKRPIGFSTGALTPGDCRRGLTMLQARQLPVVELSALREEELSPLLAELPSLELTSFDHVSIHAPSRLARLSERETAAMLRSLLPRRWPIIVHPDVMKDRSAWTGFGDLLCIENMDKRKAVGRTVAELEPFFQAFPDASWCFDIGHARQVDPTMSEAILLLERFKHRLRQVHMSEVNARSSHEAVTYPAIQSFRKVAGLIPLKVPIVLETTVSEEQIDEQIKRAATVFRAGEMAG